MSQAIGVESLLMEDDSIRRSRILGTIWELITGAWISRDGRCGWARTMGMWKLPTWGLSYGVMPPLFGRERPLIASVNRQ